ncbi:MAG: hypothetical protein RR315_03890, partial [Oscillospiraceae bacterium]
LGISYDEQPVDEVYAVMSDEAGSVHHNKLREQYKLTLLDENLVARISTPMDEMVKRLPIYSDADVEVVQLTPRFLPQDSQLVIRVQITRLNSGGSEYSFTYSLDTPGLRNNDAQQVTEVVVNNLQLAQGETKSFDYTLSPDAYVYGGGTTLSVKSFVIRKGGEEAFSLNQEISVDIKAVPKGLTDFYLTSFYNKPMDKVLGDSYDERLWIAKISMLRQNTSVIIDSISPPPFQQYSYNSQQLMALRRLEAFYPKEKAAASSQLAPTAGGGVSVLPGIAEQSRNTASGVFSLPLGLGYNAKEIIFSEEIMHGLGLGPVYVDVGVEYIYTDKKRGSKSEIILGDISIFEKDAQAGDGERIYKLSTAVKVLPERGTFVVGVRLDDTSGPISLRVRWFAIKLGEISKQIKQKQNDGERMLLVNPDTIVMQPKATTHITPVFINMPTEVCVYKLMDAEDGTIDQNGLYTAPSREGVYEIRVEALSDPTVYTHAFAIVTQKKKE